MSGEQTKDDSLTSQRQFLTRRSAALVRRGLSDVVILQSSESSDDSGVAVLVEAFSVVVRRDAIGERFAGGWHGFLDQVPNRTLCSAPELARVGFMSPADVEAYTSTLEAGGLLLRKDGKAVDFTVVDQLRGPTLPTPWLEFGKIETGGMKISACWRARQSPKQIAVPDGWKYEGSLSAQPEFADETTNHDRLKFIRRKDGLDLYMDLSAGKEVFIRRPNIVGDSEPAISTRLETICHEVRDIDVKIQPLRAAQDERGLEPLFYRLNTELLPAVQQIVGGGGKHLAFAHFTLGLILRLLHRREEAERAFRKANELQPGVINTLLELVRCVGEQDKHFEALTFAREAVRLGPVDAGAWGNLAMCLISCGEREEARKAIEHAIELDPQDRINRYVWENFEGYFQAAP
jgi:hypothetical protein